MGSLGGEHDLYRWAWRYVRRHRPTARAWCMCGLESCPLRLERAHLAAVRKAIRAAMDSYIERHWYGVEVRRG